MRFARWTFLFSAIYGLLVTLPLFFIEQRLGHDDPPAITHPEFFYGFAGLCAAWQVMFLLIASDPRRYRPAMPVGVLEKLGFVIAAPALYLQHRVSAGMLGFAAADGLMAVLFFLAYLKTPR